MSLSVDKNATVCWQPLGLKELMMKERMKNEGERVYILNLAEGLCLLVMDLGGETQTSSENSGCWNGVRSSKKDSHDQNKKSLNIRHQKSHCVCVCVFCLKLTSPGN